MHVCVLRHWRGGGGQKGGVDFQEHVWSLVSPLVEKNTGTFFDTKSWPACQISADSEQLEKSQRNRYTRLSLTEPFNCKCCYPSSTSCSRSLIGHVTANGDSLANINFECIFQFLESMQLKYHEQAVASDVLVVGTCGFDSIPADMGVLFTQEQFPGTVCLEYC